MNRRYGSFPVSEVLQLHDQIIKEFVTYMLGGMRAL